MALIKTVITLKSAINAVIKLLATETAGDTACGLDTMESSAKSTPSAMGTPAARHTVVM